MDSKAKYQFAAELPTARIYRYRSIADDKLEYISRIFSHNELHFSRPTELNDPWESRPWFRACAGFDKTRTVDSALALMKLGNASLNEEAARQWLEGLTLAQHEDFAREITEGYQQALFGDLQICSFSANPMHPLLWSHYTNSHRGICLEFDTTKGEFGTAIKVGYQSDYPVLEIFATDADELLHATALTKSSCWSYEEEYRLVTRQSAPRGALKLSGNAYVFPPESLTGVILGCQISDKHRELVLHLAQARKAPMRILVATRHEERFELKLESASAAGQQKDSRG